MTRMTSELAPLSKLSHQTRSRTIGPYTWFNLQQAHIHGGSSVESGLKPGNLRPLNRRREQTPTNRKAHNVHKTCENVCHQIDVTVYCKKGTKRKS
ncbi:hypothetical protein AVEN_183893-1 [Araneus ventricosus]|uniref:Uncharacterized protein n=1 Tax=Araneus ventricosus TaxID=182803 RepID=A0A4Y2V8M2_ARAVE|nr:hypothetical protein AVEN_183893-1 [Araneus ventricosus]